MALVAPAYAQHGRFQDDLLDSGGAGLGLFLTLLVVVTTVLIVTSVLKGSEERNRQAARTGFIGAGIGFVIGLVVGWPIGLMVLFGLLGFLLGYGHEGPPSG